MSRETRQGYEFSRRTKLEVKREQGGTCFLCSERHGLQAHHILPINVAKTKFNLNPDKVRDKENLIYLCDTHHKQLHKSLSNMSGAFKRVYFNAMCEHLLETGQLALV